MATSFSLTPAIASTLDEWEASGRRARLAPGTYVITEPIELDTGESLVGSGANTIIEADVSMYDTGDPPAMITNKLAATMDASGLGTTDDGATMRCRVADLCIDGGESIGNDPYLYESGHIEKLLGVYFNAPGSRVENVLAYNVPGMAIRVTRHQGTMTGSAHIYDIFKNTISNCAVLNSYDGVHASGADAIVHNLVCARISRTGLTLGAAAFCTSYHGWGCGTGLLTSGGPSYSEIIETENCDVGWDSQTSGARVGFWKCFACRDYDINLDSYAVCDNYWVSTTSEGTNRTPIQSGTKKLWPSTAEYWQGLVNTHIAHSIEEWERSGRTARLGPGTHVITSPIVLDTGESLRGVGRETIIKAGASMLNATTPPAMITSKDYTAHLAVPNAWTHDDVPFAIKIEDLQLDGSGDVSDSITTDIGQSDTIHGIRMYGGGFLFNNVHVYDVSGVAIQWNRINKNRVGEKLIYDSSVTTLRDCSAHKCYGGVYANDSDPVVNGLSVHSIRDTGLKVNSGAKVDDLHAYYCGIGFQNIGSKVYVGKMITETCTTGWQCDGSSCYVQFWRAFDNTTEDADFNSYSPYILSRFTDGTINGAYYETAVPEAFGNISVSGNTTAESTVDATPRKVTAFDTVNESTSNVGASSSNDELTYYQWGKFQVTAHVSYSGTASKTFKLEIYKYDSSATSWASAGFVSTRKLDANGDIESISIGGVVSLSQNDKIALYQSSIDGGTSLTVRDASLFINQVGR